MHRGLQKAAWIAVFSLFIISFGFAVWRAEQPPHTANRQISDESHAKRDVRERWELFWEKTTDDPVAFFNLWLVVFTAVLSVSTIGLWVSTRGVLRAAIDQGDAMERTINEHATSARAMTSVAASMEENVRRIRETVEINRTIAERQKQLGGLQLRAYISVVINSATYQERSKNLRFAAMPLLLNDGQTPAYDLAYTIRAAILPHPLPDDFIFPDPPPVSSDDVMIGPRQSRIMSGVVDGFSDESEVDAIKYSNGKALYAWGSVTYRDALQDRHTTYFCHRMFWITNDKVFGTYVPNRNNAD